MASRVPQTPETQYEKYSGHVADVSKLFESESDVNEVQGRGPQLDVIHTPLAFAGSVYSFMGDLGYAVAHELLGVDKTETSSTTSSSDNGIDFETPLEHAVQYDWDAMFVYTETNDYVMQTENVTTYDENLNHWADQYNEAFVEELRENSANAMKVNELDSEDDDSCSDAIDYLVRRFQEVDGMFVDARRVVLGTNDLVRFRIESIYQVFKQGGNSIELRLIDNLPNGFKSHNVLEFIPGTMDWEVSSDQKSIAGSISDLNLGHRTLSSTNKVLDDLSKYVPNIRVDTEYDHRENTECKLVGMSMRYNIEPFLLESGSQAAVQLAVINIVPDLVNDKLVRRGNWQKSHGLAISAIRFQMNSDYGFFEYSYDVALDSELLAAVGDDRETALEVCEIAFDLVKENMSKALAIISKSKSSEIDGDNSPSCDLMEGDAPSRFLCLSQQCLITESSIPNESKGNDIHNSCNDDSNMQFVDSSLLGFPPDLIQTDESVNITNGEKLTAEIAVYDDDDWHEFISHLRDIDTKLRSELAQISQGITQDHQCYRSTF